MFLRRRRTACERDTDRDGSPPRTSSTGRACARGNRLCSITLLEANDEWHPQNRYMQVEAMAELLAPPTIEGEVAPADDTQVTPQAA